MAVEDPPKVSPDDPGEDDRRRDALAVVNGFIQVYEGYRSRKEEMTWLATVLYLGGAAFLVAGKPFWQSWPIHWFGAWMVLLACTSIAAVWFVQWQFTQRHRASAFLEACYDTAAYWLHTGVSPDDLRPTPLRQMSDMVVPARLARVFGYRGTLSTPQALTLVLMVLWAVAAGISVMLTYKGPGIPS